MKALKEKRISLRSLWRRGLVILSLFALVFASCANETDEGGSSSGGNNNVVTPDKVPERISVFSKAANKSYEGLPIDLTGLVVRVQYSGSTTWEPITDLSKIIVTPPIAIYDASLGNSDPELNLYRDYQFQYASGGRVVDIPTLEVGLPGIYPLKRTNTNDMEKEPTLVGTDNSAYYNNGVMLTGLSTMAQKTVYVDGRPDFTGLTCEANYENGDKMDIPLKTDIIKWEIKPRYNSDDGFPTTGAGYLAITVGSYTKPDKTVVSSGVTVFAPYQEVYNVTKIEIQIEPEEVPHFFYWENDSSSDFWFNKFKETNAKILVTYSSNAPEPTKRFTIEEALYENQVWKNSNPVPDMKPFAIEGIEETAKRLNGKDAKLDWPKYKTPQVTFYYRGFRGLLDMPIYNTFKGITATYKDGVDLIDGRLEVDMGMDDNDFYFGKRDEWYAKKVLVKAGFTASSVSGGETYYIPLYYQRTPSPGTVANEGKPFDLSEGAWNPDNAGDPEDGYYKTGPLVYTMDFGKADITDYFAAGTPDKAGKLDSSKDWWGVSTNSKNNNKNGNVTFYYTPGLAYTPVTTSPNVFIPTGAPKAKTAKLQVTWRNIPPAVSP